MFSTRYIGAIGYSFPAFIVAGFVFWLIYSEATKPVVDSWVESGTIVDYVSRAKSDDRVSRQVNPKRSYFIDVRTSDGEIVRVPAGTREPKIGRTVTIQWLEYEDGSVAARLAKKKKSKNSFSLNNI